MQVIRILTYPTRTIHRNPTPSVVLWPAGSGLPQRRLGATSPPAGGAPCYRSNYSDVTRIWQPAASHRVACQQHFALLCRWWPDTNARATLTTQSEREGGDCSESKPKRVLPTGPPATTTTHGTNVKASPSGAFVVPCGCEGTHQYAMKEWSWANQQRPGRASVPALDLQKNSNSAQFILWFWSLVRWQDFNFEPES